MCTECASNDLSFASYAELQAHIKSVHPPECPHCSFRCETSRELRRHLEISHGEVSLEDRRQFPCSVPGCGRSFTKKGNLTVHIRTVHDGEKRFVCGESDLSSSKKVVGWDGADACGKRYSSKIALEEHVRTTHMGLPSSKAERRERLGLTKETNKRPTNSQISTMTLLTGEGYADESGRHIPCFVSECRYRFFRDYDLWVHMRSKHGCEESNIDRFFAERACALHENTDTVLGIYGLELDQFQESHGSPSIEQNTSLYFPHDGASEGSMLSFFQDAQPARNDFDQQMSDIAFFNTLDDVGCNTSVGFGTEDDLVA